MEGILFQNKYRVPSARLTGFDYSRDGYYFVTICTKYRIECFGSIMDAKMGLSLLGLATDECWRAIPKHFPFVRLDEYIIMPNHVHGILEIYNNVGNVETQNVASHTPTETQNVASLRHDKPYKNKFGPQSKNISSIIRGFKIGVTKYAHQNGIPFMWQERFYDRIIRDERALYKIRQYIIENPAKWWRDRNNSSHMFM